MEQEPQPSQQNPVYQNMLNESIDAIKLIQARPKIEGKLTCQIINFRTANLFDVDSLFAEETNSIILSCFLASISPEDVKHIFYHDTNWYVVYIYHLTQESIFDSILKQHKGETSHAEILSSSGNAEPS